MTKETEQKVNDILQSMTNSEALAYLEDEKGYWGDTGFLPYMCVALAGRIGVNIRNEKDEREGEWLNRVLKRIRKKSKEDGFDSMRDDTAFQRRWLRTCIKVNIGSNYEDESIRAALKEITGTEYKRGKAYYRRFDMLCQIRDALETIEDIDRLKQIRAYTENLKGQSESVTPGAFDLIFEWGAFGCTYNIDSHDDGAY